MKPTKKGNTREKNKSKSKFHKMGENMGIE